MAAPFRRFAPAVLAAALLPVLATGALADPPPGKGGGSGPKPKASPTDSPDHSPTASPSASATPDPGSTPSATPATSPTAGPTPTGSMTPTPLTSSPPVPTAMTAIGYRELCIEGNPTNCGDSVLYGQVVHAAGEDVGVGVAGVAVYIKVSNYTARVTTDAEGKFSLHVWVTHYTMPFPISVTFLEMRPPTWVAYTELDERYLPSAAAGTFVPRPS